MKVKITATFELPESYDTATDRELRTLFYEELFRTAHTAHLEEAIELEMGKPNHADSNGNVVTMLDAARKVSLEWAKITDRPEWTLEKV